MAADQPNFGYQKYVDDDGNGWNVRSETGGPFAGVDGHAALDATLPAWGRQSRFRHVRRVVAMDPTTFRTVRGVIFTAAAYAAIHRGDVIPVHVQGEVAAVNYTVSAKLAEKLPGVNTARQVADHA